MTELWPLMQGAKKRAASKNYPNLTITLPNFNIFNKTSFIEQHKSFKKIKIRGKGVRSCMQDTFARATHSA